VKTATALAVVAVGAIFAFAVTAHPAFFNFQVAGWVLIVVGLAGLLIPRQRYMWLLGRVDSRAGSPVARRRNSPRSRRSRPLVWRGGPLIWRRGPAEGVVGTVEEAGGTSYVVIAPEAELPAVDPLVAPGPETGGLPPPSGPDHGGQENRMSGEDEATQGMPPQ
jgi:hypothetical protein